MMNDTTDERISRENERLRRAVKELSILNEIAVAIGSSMSLEDVVDLIVKKCVKHLHVEQTAVMLLESEDEEKPFHTMVRKADRTSMILSYRLDSQLSGWMLKYKKPLLVQDFPNDERFICPDEEDCDIQSLIGTPLILKGRMIGILICFNKKTEGGFTEEDQRLLSIIAGQSAQVIENARLYEEEQNLIRMQQEVKLAQEIQLGLLPKEAPVIEGYDIAGVSHPAKVVGGDYFDYIALDQKRIAVCVGDISGKGLPAALLMSNLQATIRGQALVNPSPSACLQKTNMLLHQCTHASKFATLVYGVLDAESHTFSYTNAGHNPPLLVQKGKEPILLKLEKPGIALSLLENTSYTAEDIKFGPEDSLLIYSDGITEAMNPSFEEYGEERFIQLIKQNQNLSAQGIMDAVIKDVRRFSDEHPQSDDMTMVVIKRQG